ncbi:hypothetical protein BG418_09265 [Streptomyces sp. CBMA152]|nr:hypothetical protein [Streptomyces sp. CBMA152]MBD0741673.1 hypothetical protein [Streptomyces sp. CBMA152]
MLRTLTRALCAVGVLALVFTAVNVTLFAASRGVPIWIAALLDPMLALALAAILYADARLAAWGIRPPAWSAALRWWAGCTAAVMNTWTSVWPDGGIGRPRHADVAGVLLHLVPCLLLVGLAETIAAYRKIITEVRHHTPPAPPVVRPNHPPHLAAPAQTDHGLGVAAPTDRSDAGAARPDIGDVRPDLPLEALYPRPGAERPVDADLFTRAQALDAAVRERTGRPVSIRQLRRHLHLGQERARALRTRLDAPLPPGAPAPDHAPESAPEQER